MPTMLEVISAIEEAVFAISQVGLAVLMLVVAVRIYHWIERAL